MLTIVARTLICTSIIEFLNSFGSEIEYQYTAPEYLAENEIAVFLIKGKKDDLGAIKGFMRSAYDTYSVMAAFFLEKEER